MDQMTDYSKYNNDIKEPNGRRNHITKKKYEEMALKNRK